MSCDVRRTRPTRRSLSWLVPGLLLLFALGACKALPGSNSSSSATASATPSSSESEKTRKIEEKAAEIQRHEEDLRNMTGTDQEKIDAANKIDQERRELQEMQESNGSS
jgi:TolA-binding protein